MVCFCRPTCFPLITVVSDYIRSVLYNLKSFATSPCLYLLIYVEIFYAKCVGRFMVYRYTKFRIPSFSGPSVIAAKLNAKCVVPTATMYILKNVYLDVAYFSKLFSPYKITGSHINWLYRCLHRHVGAIIGRGLQIRKVVLSLVTYEFLLKSVSWIES